MHRTALVSAALAPVALIGGWTLAATRQPAAYDATRDTISALAAVGADDRWVMTTGFVVLGGCHVVTALGLTEAHRLGRVVLGAGGVAALGVAVAAEPSAAHVPVATASFVALSLWPGLSGLPGRRSGWAATVVLGGLLGWFSLELGGPRSGLAERVVAGAQVLWPLAVVLALRARGRTSRRAAGPAARPAVS
ncbi:DUF998 domain-containing protein [Nocardioides sp. AX2bis]|uniref:DUF998 domain-containing protein n=1 Tax=Nocardioides sp. AX2bis TaxID=2653157 RepID=UPI0012F40FF9|nr:DUF998 domain-containing protein [Nocardioides sp. AX2bis]VXC39824.1 conserved membrane hypothetical protein [Nocardioides sp. AX2bis]